MSGSGVTRAGHWRLGDGAVVRPSRSTGPSRDQLLGRRHRLLVGTWVVVGYAVITFAITPLVASTVFFLVGGLTLVYLAMLLTAERLRLDRHLARSWHPTSIVEGSATRATRLRRSRRYWWPATMGAWVLLSALCASLASRDDDQGLIPALLSDWFWTPVWLLMTACCVVIARRLVAEPS